MKKQTLFTVSIVSFLLAAACFYAATRYLDALVAERLFAPVVKVAKGKEISPYEPITREDVVLVQEETDEIYPGSYQTIESVLGKRSVQTIYEGEQLVDKKLSESHLLPDKGKARYEFPLHSIMPVTELRKGDYVKLWVKYKPITELQSLPEPMHFRKSNTTADPLFESQLVTVKDNNGMEIYTLKQSLMPGAEQMESAVFKGSEAKKYTNAEKRYRDYRAQPTSLPAYIGFNLTDQQFVVLSEAMNYGTVQIGHILAAEEVQSR
ncbi:SAF domain-containing protein [Brevibacillus sp. H7]|uniref:SAF domain-containing protein n=1 Tax=Brevibacillus sp. H7 TaxID=3349138 RepID=UPI00380664E5